MLATIQTLKAEVTEPNCQQKPKGTDVDDGMASRGLTAFQSRATSVSQNIEHLAALPLGTDVPAGRCSLRKAVIPVGTTLQVHLLFANSWKSAMVDSGVSLSLPPNIEWTKASWSGVKVPGAADFPFATA